MTNEEYKNISLYRRRYVPDELILLKDDEILLVNEDVIITKWKVLRPRKDFTNGKSCYYLKKGFKVSKYLDDTGKLVYYYCDIIRTIYDAEKNAYTVEDLLVDVIIMEDGFVKVMDLEEIAWALDRKLIDIDTAKKALVLVDELLRIIYSGRFSELADCLE